MSKSSEPRRDNRVLKTLERVFSKAGRGSRTEARRWIGEGRVGVNGVIARSPDKWVDLARDRVTLDGKPITTTRGIYILLYKPKGYLTTYQDPENRPTVYDLVADLDAWLAPVGRLDLETSGLLLMTNDTAFADHVTSPAHLVPKTYQAKTATLLSEEQLERLRGGIELSDGPTRPAEVRRLRDGPKHTFIEIVLTEGRNRQVRRMVEAAGSRVLKLVRTAIGPLRIGDLAIGKWRRLTEEEIAALGGRARPAGPATSNTSEAKPAARSRSRECRKWH
ncbi:MAG: pseudouridine synthase [Bryobacteraceae bacterium]